MDCYAGQRKNERLGGGRKEGSGLEGMLIVPLHSRGVNVWISRGSSSSGLDG